jgi:hypothetical protein
MPFGDMLPLGVWQPDRSDYREPGLIRATNVLPREDGLYGPANAFSAYTAALASRCKGALTTRTSTGSAVTFAGTETGLYRLGSDNNWNEVGSGYSVSADDRWQWSVYQDSLIATGGLNIVPQVWDLAIGTVFEPLSADAPAARYSAVINDFLVLASTSADDGVRPDQIWWSAKGVPNSFPEPGTDDAISVQSSKRQIPDGGGIQGIQGGIGGADGAIFGESRIWRMTYVGPREIFQIDPVERSRGVYAAGSLTQVGRIAYYLAEDGWFAFDGVQSTPIGAGQWDREFLDDLDDSNKSALFAAVDTNSKTILCAYPGTGNDNGIPNRLLAYNYVSQRASIVEIETEGLFQLRSQGYTLDSLDTLGYTMETLPFSLDSRAWAGGGAFIGGVSSDHVLGQFNGTTLQGDLTLSEWSDPTHDRLFINGVRPITDCTNVQAAISYREEMGADTALTTTGYSIRGRDRACRQRVSTRYARVLLRFPAGEAWTSAQGVQLDIQPDGDA